MTKKKPNHKNLRQGQTLYYVNTVTADRLNYGNPEIVPIFLHSQKVPLPPAWEIIDRRPVTSAREWLKEWGNHWHFFSRAKAKSYMKLHCKNHQEETLINGSMKLSK